MSLPPVHVRSAPAAGLATQPAARKREDTPHEGGKPFDLLLSERKGLDANANAVLPENGNDTHASSVAEMFNERGFFQGAVSLQSTGVDPVEVDPASVQPIGTVDERAGAERPSLMVPTSRPTIRAARAEAHMSEQGKADQASSALRNLIGAMRVDGLRTGVLVGGQGRLSSVGSGSRSLLLLSSGLRQARPGLNTQVPASEGQANVEAGRETLPDAEGAPASPAMQKRLAAMIENQLRRTNAVHVRVDVRAMQDGLHVLARTDKLDRNERNRLQSEIAALLSRHGRVAARISFNGETVLARRP